ncbi:MAG TPA: four helix bundle protein [Candidatus Tectomicrobia bacterium]|nr:four helix bundle protein [Candidatus Tectomicrobia bacterium]
MDRIERFEDIEAWQQARKLVQMVNKATARGAFSKNFGFLNQMECAPVSIMANIAEGFDGGSNREFLRFLGYALRSTTEVQSHLYVALDQSYIDQRQFRALYDLSITVKSLISGFMRYLRSSSKVSNLAPRTLPLEL